jgi:hypothetical protein
LRHGLAALGEGFGIHVHQPDLADGGASLLFRQFLGAGAIAQDAHAHAHGAGSHQHHGVAFIVQQGKLGHQMVELVPGRGVVVPHQDFGAHLDHHAVQGLEQVFAYVVHGEER